ncbi:MAG: hypothetical protein FWE38_02030 [Firmicutes bacterium]|nr:hypothetical protein [Bacillota bacterium]
MKKLLGVIFMCVACGIAMPAFSMPSTSVSATPSPRIESTNVTDATWTLVTGRDEFPSSHEQFSLFAGIHGIFIQRQEGHGLGDMFYGHIYVNRDELNFNIFEFETLIMRDGVWERTDLFNVWPMGMGRIQFEFPKVLPAGRYGIRMVAYELTFENGVETRTRGRVLDVFGNWRDAEVIYSILYADPLRYFIAETEEGANFHNAWIAGGRGRTVNVNIRTNPGAMDLDALPHHVVDGHRMGNLYVDAQISFPQVAVPGGDETEGLVALVFLRHIQQPVATLPIIITPRGMTVTVPANLAQGRFVIRFHHSTNEDITGRFVIDNTPGVLFLPSNMRVLVPIFMTLGAIAGVAAVGFFFLPKYLVFRQERKYVEKENERYSQAGGEGPDDKKFKAQSAKDAFLNSKQKRNESRSRGFLAKMHSERAKRDMARDAGLTMEEFREIEAKQKALDDARAKSLRDVREVDDAPEQKEETVFRGGAEFNMLDSIQNQASFADDAMIKEVVQPNLSGQESILAGLRNLAGDESTARVDISANPFDDLFGPPAPVAETLTPDPFASTPIMAPPQTPAPVTPPPPPPQVVDDSDW